MKIPSFSQFLHASSLLALLVLLACQKSTDSTQTPTNSTVPDVFKQFNSNLQISTDGDYIVIKSDGVPDHKSPYFQQTDTRYEAYNGSNPNFRLNPNSIRSQSLTFRIPRNPQTASSPSNTPMGPIGIALNGVPFYNQYAAMNAPLTNEINSFDQYNAHPQQTGQYHYHVEPLYLTKTKGNSALLGFLLDGFPVYGPIENGKTITNADLDAYHGHSHATPEYPNGIYHYHFTAQDPYLNGGKYYGTPGTVSQ